MPILVADGPESCPLDVHPGAYYGLSVSGIPDDSFYAVDVSIILCAQSYGTEQGEKYGNDLLFHPCFSKVRKDKKGTCESIYLNIGTLTLF